MNNCLLKNKKDLWNERKVNKMKIKNLKNAVFSNKNSSFWWRILLKLNWKESLRRGKKEQNTYGKFWEKTYGEKYNKNQLWILSKSKLINLIPGHSMVFQKGNKQGWSKRKLFIKV